MISLLAGVTIYFAFQQWLHWRHKRWASPIKLTLLASSIAFWWYCNNGVQNILVGIALFEVFHDVQYLAIVWIYNRSRVERDESIRRLHAVCFQKKRRSYWCLCWPGLSLWINCLFHFGCFCLLDSPCSYRTSYRVGFTPFLLRRVYLES